MQTWSILIIVDTAFGLSALYKANDKQLYTAGLV